MLLHRCHVFLVLVPLSAPDRVTTPILWVLSSKKIWFKLTPRIFYYQITPVLHGVSRPEKVANGRVTTDWLKHPEHRKMFQYCESTRSRSGRRVIVASTRTARYKKSKIPSLAKIVAAQTLVILDISSRLSLYVHYHYHYRCCCCCCCCCCCYYY